MSKILDDDQFWYRKVLYDFGDYTQAIDHQEKAIIIYERTLGLDHYDTLQAYSSLTIFKLEQSENMEGNFIINLMKRSLFLSYLIGGPKNPETTLYLSNIGTIFQYQAKFEESIKYYNFALSNTINNFGPIHLKTAQMYHTIAYVYSLAENFNEALKMEQKNYEILRVTVGEKDLLTIESNIWLKQLTKSALSEVKKNMSAKKNVPKNQRNQKVTIEGQIRASGTRGGARGGKTGRGGRVIRVVKKNVPTNIEEVTEINTQEPTNVKETPTTLPPQSNQSNATRGGKRNKKNRGKKIIILSKNNIKKQF